MVLEVAVEIAKFLESERVGCAMWLFTGIVYLPYSWVKALGVADVVIYYENWFKVGFIVFSALCVVHAGAWGLSKSPFLYKRWTVKKKLHRLSTDEREVLRKFITQNTKTNMYQVTNGTVGGLEREGILYRASDWMKGSKIAYNLPDWIWNYLNNHPSLLDDE